MRRAFFFSWQTDTPGGTGRFLIRDALKEACKAASAELALDEPERESRIEVDSDTQDVPGHPPIFDTILKKIEETTAFVADFTFVAGKPGRLIPNPNVATEYGYALKVLGHGRMILVMNTAHGNPDNEPLPFDMRHFTRPVQFHLPDDADRQQIAIERKKLVDEFKRRIRLIVKDLEPDVKPQPPPFPEAQAQVGMARFRPNAEPVGISEVPFAVKSTEIWLSHGPAIWLRLMPQRGPGGDFSTTSLFQAAQRGGGVCLMPLMSHGANTLRGPDGVGYFSGHDAGTGTAKSVAYVFGTGEIWSTDTWILSASESQLPIVTILQVLRQSLPGYGRLLKNLGFEAPYRWIAGVEQVKGRRADNPNGISLRQNECLVQNIQASGTYDGVESTALVLRPLEQQLYAKCGLDAP